MSFSIIDKNTKEVIQGGFSTENDALDALIDNGATEEEINSVYDVVQDSSNMPKNSQKTTRAERMEAFGKDAEYWPSVAEQFMKGNTDFNLGTLKAGVSDFLSLPGRIATSYMNYAKNGKGPQDWNEEFNLGLRSGEEGTNIFSSMLRDPTTPIISGAGKLLAKGVSKGAEIGGRVLDYALGKIIPKAAPVIGKAAGAATAGATEGLLTELVSSELNQREPEYRLSALLGGGFEGAGSLISQILQKNGKEYLKSIASSLRLGNTDRVMTDEEFIAFLSDPRNRDALEKALKAGSSGLNATPFVGDRGKKLQPEVNKAKKEAEDVLQGEDAFKGFDEGIDQNLPIGAQNDQRKLNALRMKQDGETETMNLATKFKEKKNSTYKPNAYRYMDKFFNKYNKIQSKVLKKPSVERPMSQDEYFILDQLKNEMEADKSIINGYTPEKVISENKFLSDRMPFNDEFYENTLNPFLEGNKNVSHAFLTELHKIVGGTKVGIEKAAELREALSGLEEASLKRALVKSDKNIEVKKGYDEAMKKFKDTLDAYATMRVGRPGVNADGKDYIVGEENMKNYVFEYLRHVQDALSRNGALKPDEIVSLYGMATNVNDKTVQDAIIQLLRDLNVSESVVKKFEQVGGNYAMLNKARTRMKKNANEDNPFKGTMVAPIVPQEGFNAKNAIGWRLQGGNINLGDLSTTTNSTRIGRGVRQAVYNLGLPYARSRE